MRKVTFLVVHHTASPKTTTVAQVTEWHLKRGFSTIGYHALIYGTGQVNRGRSEAIVGAHALGANRDSLGVSLSGNFDKEMPEQIQITKLVRLLAYWCKTYGVSPTEIYGHRQKGTTKTACPGTNLFKEMTRIKKEVADLLANKNAISQLRWETI